MPYLMTLLVGLSALGLISLFAHWARRDADWRLFGLRITALLIYIGFLHLLFGFPLFTETAVARSGSGHSVAVVILLYLFMLAGMVAQHAYLRFQRPRARRKRFDLGVFLAPVFASPIVFLPLLAALQNAELDLARLDATRMMLFFVAFQNGFFWKEYVDHRRADIQSDDHAPQSA